MNSIYKSIIEQNNIIDKINNIHHDNINSDIYKLRNIIKCKDNNIFNIFIEMCDNILSIVVLNSEEQQIINIINIGIDNIDNYIFRGVNIIIECILEIINTEDISIEINYIINKFIWYYINIKKYKIYDYNNDINDYIYKLAKEFSYNNIFLIEIQNTIELFNGKIEDIINKNIPINHLIVLLQCLSDNPIFLFNQLKLIKKHIYNLDKESKNKFNKVYIKDYYAYKNRLLDNIYIFSDSE
jgi:hypothetical protein